MATVIASNGYFNQPMNMTSSGYQMPMVTTQQVAPSPQKNRAPKRPYIEAGAAQASIAAASTMHNEIRMVETTIQELLMENEALKTKLLEIRRTSLDKFFMADANLAIQRIFPMWLKVVKELKRLGEIDGVNALREGDRGEFERRQQELLARIQELDRLQRQQHAEAAAARSQLDRINGLIMSKDAENAGLAQRVQELEQALDQARHDQANAKEAQSLRNRQLEEAENVVDGFARAARGYEFVTDPLGPVTVPMHQRDSFIRDRLNGVLREPAIAGVPSLLPGTM